MKKLIALAAVLGLAVSSWGLTLQDAPVAPGATAAVLVEAQVGRHLTRGIMWGPRTRPGGELSIYAVPTWPEILEWYRSAAKKVIGSTGG